MCLRRILLLMGCLLPGTGQAVVPGEAAFEQAVQALRAAARERGLELRTDGLPLAQWRAGLPMAASWEPGVCRIGFLPWLAAQRFAWLFPALPAGQETLWLEGLVAHELAHCEEAAAGAGLAGGQRRADEIAADLAFAAHVLRRSPAEGPALVERLARLRDTFAARDPTRDSGAALRASLPCTAPSEGRPCAAPAGR